jgi:hypothetical protein
MALQRPGAAESRRHSFLRRVLCILDAEEGLAEALVCERRLAADVQAALPLR